MKKRTNTRQKKKRGGNKEDTTRVGRNMEPWRKCGAHTKEFMKDMYCKDNIKYLTRDITQERDLQKSKVSCWGYRNVFWG
jgi:hypothetical protein